MLIRTPLGPSVVGPGRRNLAACDILLTPHDDAG